MASLLLGDPLYDQAKRQLFTRGQLYKGREDPVFLVILSDDGHTATISLNQAQRTGMLGPGCLATHAHQLLELEGSGWLGVSISRNEQ